MRKIPGKALAILLAIPAGILVLLLLAPWLIGQERLRELAEELANEHAGLELHIAEPVKLRLLPRPSLVLEGVSMHLTHGATTAGAAVPLLQAERLEMALAVLPLFSQNLEIAQVELLRPVLHLLRNEEGRWNWQTTPAASAAQKKRSFGTADLQQALAPLRSLDLRMKQGRVHVQDLVRNTTLDLQKMQLELQGRQQKQRYQVERFTLAGKLLGPQLPWDAPVALDVAATASFDMQAGLLALDIRSASLQRVSLAGGVEVRQIFQAPEAQGSLFLSAPVNAVPGLAFLDAASGNGGVCSLDLTFRGPLQELELPSLALALRQSGQAPDIVLEGNGRLRQAETTALELALHGERLDVTPFVRASSDDPPRQESWPQPAQLLAWTRGLALDVSLQLDSLQLEEFTLQELRLHSVAQPGELQLSGPDQAPLAKVANGRLQADLRASQENAGLDLAADISLEGGDVLRLLAPLTSGPMLEGAASAQLSLNARGRDWPGLAASLQGSLQLEVRHGAHASLEKHAAQRSFSLLEGNFTLQGFADASEPHTPTHSGAAPEAGQETP